MGAKVENYNVFNVSKTWGATFTYDAKKSYHFWHVKINILSFSSRRYEWDFYKSSKGGRINCMWAYQPLD
jgi:hypothetical protein